MFAPATITLRESKQHDFVSALPKRLGFETGWLRSCKSFQVQRRPPIPMPRNSPRSLPRLAGRTKLVGGSRQDAEFVSVVYMPDRISYCRATCGETNHSVGQITRRRKADRLWAINPQKPSTSRRRRSKPKPSNQNSRSSRPCSRNNRPIKRSNRRQLGGPHSTRSCRDAKATWVTSLSSGFLRCM